MVFKVRQLQTSSDGGGGGVGAGGGGARRGRAPGNANHRASFQKVTSQRLALTTPKLSLRMPSEQGLLQVALFQSFQYPSGVNCVSLSERGSEMAVAVGSEIEVYCTVKLSLPTKENLDTFEQAVAKWAEVVQCATVTGAADYEMRIVTRDMRAFDEFLRDKLLSLGLVSNIESRIVIRGVKNSTAVPLGLISPYVSPLG